MNYEDEQVQELHDQLYQREAERPNTTFSQMHPNIKFIAGIGIVALLALYFTGKLTGKQAIIFGAAGVFILFLMKGTTPTTGKLTMIELMIRLYDQLKFLQQHPISDIPEIPKGKIHITPIGREQWVEGKVVKRSFGVEIYDEKKDITFIYYTEQDIYTGEIIACKDAPEGVYGDETKDLKVMPTYSMYLEKRRNQYLDKGNKV